MTMVAQVLRGIPRAREMRRALGERVQQFRQQGHPAPVLAAIQVGRHPSCAAYAEVQQRIAGEVGIVYRPLVFEADIHERALIDEIRRLNDDADVHGILVHLPLPEQIERQRVHEAIAPQKDVEGVHPLHLWLGENKTALAKIVSPTALAVLELIEQCQEQDYLKELIGCEAVIVGHSDLIGKPLALLLLGRMATVTVCHRGTFDRGTLAEHVGRAELLVSAVGRSGLVRGAWVREGAVVIDVGTTQVGDKVVGDVEFEAAAQRAKAITPVPGGVGPLTVAFLMQNVATVYARQLGVTV